MEEPRFKWKNFIEVSDEWGEQERADIIATLDQLEPLHIMQETLQAIPNNKMFDWQPDKIILTPMDEEGFYDPISRHILLRDDLSINNKYLDENNDEHKVSLTRLILHELQHTIDPDLHQACFEAIEIAQKDGIDFKEALGFIHYLIVEREPPTSSISTSTQINMRDTLLSRFWNENIVIGRVNDTMHAFFDEAPRAKFYMPVHQNDYEKYRMKIAKPNKLYETNVSKSVTQPVMDFLTDIQAEAKNNMKFASMIESRRETAKYNFPQGNIRQ